MVRLQSRCSKGAAIRPPVLIGVIAVAGVCALLFIITRKGPEPKPVTKAATAAPVETGVTKPTRETKPVEAVPAPPPAPPSTNIAVVAPPRNTSTNSPAKTSNLPAATGFTQQLVGQLSQIGLDGGPITPEKAEAWKSNLQRLIMEGEKGLPAIRDFLAKNEDLNLSALEGGDLLGQPTLRMALLEAMWQIGGQSALDLSVQTLQGASDPREIAGLAAYLEQQAPDQYRGMAVNAATEALNMASAGQLAGRDVGPLFDVLGRYGDANVVQNLQNAVGQWKYYAAISMAQLPNEQGLPALLQLAQDANHPSSSARLVALEMLAEKAPQNPQALNALVQQAQGGAIPDATWLTIASVLEGHQFGIGDVPPALDNPSSSNIKKFHLAYGNQNYYSVIPAGEWSPDQVNSRIAIIDQMLASKPGDLATRALQQARASLTARVAQ